MIAARFLALTVALSSVALACSQAKPKAALDTRDDDNDDDDDRDNDGDGNDGDTTPPESDPVQPDGTKPPGKVFAHTADTLYLFDPLAKSLTKQAKFDCLKQNTVPATPQLDRVLDIAVDEKDVMYGTTDLGFIKITDPATGKCIYVKETPTNNEYPNSLGFVPKGTIEDTKETLVGYAFKNGQATNFVRINLADGEITQVDPDDTTGDTLNPAVSLDGKKYRASGDIISTVRNGNRAYLTVRPIGDDTAKDTLAEIDPLTGRIKAIVGQTQETRLYGLGQWAGTAYGFAENGSLVAIDLETGSSSTVPGVDTAGLAWFGAGVTTLAPTKP